MVMAPERQAISSPVKRNVLRHSSGIQHRILIHLTSSSSDSASSLRSLSMATEASKVELPPLGQITPSSSGADAALAPMSNGADSHTQSSSSAGNVHALPQNETPQRGAKRQKVTRACDSCKARKRRCTGELPCSLCWYVFFMLPSIVIWI